MNVVHNRDERPVTRQALDENPRRPEDLLRACGRVGGADRSEQSLGDERLVGLFPEIVG